jgi:hypothetical protein
MSRSRLALAGLCLAALPALAQQQPAPPYVPSAEDRAQLEQKMSALADRLKSLNVPDKADAEVFLRIAELAARDDVHEKGPGVSLLDNKGAFQAVLRGLDTGMQRCELLARGERPWTRQPGKSLRGYRSRVDGSIQPYAVVLPSGYDPANQAPWRLDIDLHGRGTTEVKFLQSNEPAPGSNGAKPVDQPFITLLPFGRGNNGWRWSGETDVFEALSQVDHQYRIDPDRTILRGFSMGGHGSWHIGVHYPGMWAAVSPGAGFSETRKYAKIAPGTIPEYQEKSWHIYDAVDYALNMFNAPYIGYGGEIDPQLQAALNMKERAAEEMVPLTVIVGPKTEHRYHPDSFAEIMGHLSKAKREPAAKQVKFTTYTLKYNRCKWVTVDALEEHYRRADVLADATGPGITVSTRNVAALTLAPLVGSSPLKIDGQSLDFTSRKTRDSLTVEKVNGKWRFPNAAEIPVRKRHHLQGPIDDAFTDSFVVVRGTGTPWSRSTQQYADETLRRFQEEWRLGFRGELPVMDDRSLTPAMAKDANLVLFGDPGSNSRLAAIAPKLPIRWSRDGVEVNGKKYGPDAVPVLIFPNPANPGKYVVINSGHTWSAKEIRASNVQLFPRLPDWAVLKVGGSQPEVLAADYFSESWQFKK